MAYMDKLLASWREKDITTVAQAQEEHENFTTAAQKAPKGGAAAAGSTGKRVLAQQYDQREYDPDEVNDMSQEDIEEASKL